MTRLEFLLTTAAHLERAEPERLHGFRAAADKLLCWACRRGYDIDQLMAPPDIPAMLDALDGEVIRSTGGSFPHHAGLVRNPREAAVHFLSILYWIEGCRKTPSFQNLLAAIIAPFIPHTLCS